MSKKEFKALERGDTVRHVDNMHLHGVVIGNYGDHVTAVESIDMTNPDEWLVVKKAGGQ